MGWMQKLCEVYDAAIVCDQSKESVALAPFGFVIKKIKYHIVLTQNGQFVSSNELMGKEQLQEIPSTPMAESRTGGNGTPFPLVEQLQYLVYEKENLQRFSQYIQQLKAWCEQPDAPECLRAVYTYLDGHTLLHDLESQPNLKLKYYKDVEKREGVGADAKAMVCFSVQMQDNSSDDLWLRADVKQSWRRYLASILPGDKAFCYVEGKTLPILVSHPKLQGNAKLISAKDDQFLFQYKGRFVDDHSAALVSFDASIRAHNTLTWLLARQGMQKYGKMWVLWNTNGAKMKVPIDGKSSIFEEEEEEEKEKEDGVSKPVIDTFASYAKEVNTAAQGYGGRLRAYDPKRTNSVVLLGLEAASDGRMSINYYRECSGDEYIERLEDWYKDCCWWRYGQKMGTKEIATPNPDSIAIAVMGADAVNLAKSDRKQKKSHTKLISRLHAEILSCIVDKQLLPLWAVRSAFYRACAPLAFTGGKGRRWARSAWEGSVDTTCAMISCFQKRRRGEYCEVFTPELQANSTKADYLYGRLLAVADFIEEKSKEGGRDYPTNAVRFMRQFMQDPFETWPKIHEKLMLNLGGGELDQERFRALLQEIEGLFSAQDRYERRELSLEFLQGFSSQRQSFFQKRRSATKEEEDGNTRYRLSNRRSELYGYLLAIADEIEREANSEGEVSTTNAMRIMPMFAARPYESWGRLHNKLIPYMGKLGGRADEYQQQIEMVEGRFTDLDRESTEPLDGSYVHGFYCWHRINKEQAQLLREKQAWKEAKDMRSALYGRMLGIAERLERRCLLYKAEGTYKRMTNELRFMTVFAQKPAATWELLKVKLKPYLKHESSSVQQESAMLEQLEAQLRQQGWNTNVPLGSIYLHYFYEESNNKIKEEKEK